MSKPTSLLAFTRRYHNHTACVTQALAKASRLCQKRGVRLTPLRRQVLELIWQSHKPLGAYTILASLANQQGGRAAPPTVYRVLTFLLEMGLIHKIASLNAFIGCLHPDSPHIGKFLICAECGNAAELKDPHLHTALIKQAQQFGFKVEKPTIELTGLCSHCQTNHE